MIACLCVCAECLKYPLYWIFISHVSVSTATVTIQMLYHQWGGLGQNKKWLEKRKLRLYWLTCTIYSIWKNEKHSPNLPTKQTVPLVTLLRNAIWSRTAYTFTFCAFTFTCGILDYKYHVILASWQICMSFWLVDNIDLCVCFMAYCEPDSGVQLLRSAVFNLCAMAHWYAAKGLRVLQELGRVINRAFGGFEPHY